MSAHSNIVASHLQEEGGSDEAIALAVARAHERMMQADLAEAQAAVEQRRADRPNYRAAAQPAAGSHAAGRSQTQQLQALSRAEQVNTLPCAVRGVS